MFGISFDAPSENLAFRSDNGFPFALLSDEDKSVGTAYGVLRDVADPFAAYPKRIAFIIDPQGVIAAADEITDPGGYGDQALATLAAAQR